MGFRNGFPLEKINANVTQFMVVMGHSVVLSKLKIEPGIRVAFPVQFLSKLIFVEKLLWLSRKHSLQKNHQHLWNLLFHFSPAGGKKISLPLPQNLSFQTVLASNYQDIKLLPCQSRNKIQRNSRLFFVQHSI